MEHSSSAFAAQQSRERDLDEVRESARTLARRFPLSYWRDCDRDARYPWDFVNAFAKAGWMGVLMPEEYGAWGWA